MKEGGRNQLWLKWMSETFTTGNFRSLLLRIAADGSCHLMGKFVTPVVAIVMIVTVMQ